MRRLILHSSLILLFLTPGAVYAGDPPNIRGFGLARSITGLARGIGALGVNPANLGMPENRFMTFNLAPFAVRVSSELVSYDVYKEFFTGVPGPNGTREPYLLTTADKQKILDGFPEGVANSRAEVDVMPIGVSTYVQGVGGFAFATMEHVGTNLVLPKEYLRLFLYGLDSSGSTYRFDETSVSAWWWREYNLSFGMQIPVSLRNGIELYAGVGLKVVAGFGSAQTDRYNAVIANIRESQNQYRVKLLFDYLIKRSGIDYIGEQPDDEESFSLFPAPAGTGFGVDLGFAARLPNVDVHLSITDIGSVSWKRNLVETFGSYNLEFTDPFFNANDDSIQNAVRGQNRDGSPYSTSLPTRLRIGVVIGADTARPASWLPKQLVLALDLSQGFNESMGNSGALRLSFGTEYRGIPGFPIRTGISTGGDARMRWAVGFGIDAHYFSIDFALENFGMLFSPNSLDMFSFAMGIQVRT